MANEKRLIDANTLMDVIRKHEYLLATKYGSIDYGMFTLGIQQAVDEQPTIDAVEVVRCRDCKYGDWDSKPDDAMVCMRTKDGFWRSGNDFCSYGERNGGNK